MQLKNLVVSLAVVLGMGLLSGCAMTEEAAPEEATPVDPMAEWAEWMELQKPNENHARMAAMAGEWDVKSTFWMEPGAPPVESTAKASFTSLMDGRYVQHEFAGDVAGMAFTGLGLAGYDNIRQKHISVWVDSTSTGFFLTEGTYDPETGEVTEEGSMPMGVDAPLVLHRMVSRMEGDDRMIMKMYTQDENGEFHQNMELIYTRKK